MNTIHFSIQAVLSKMITWYWSGRFQPDVTISWRDYFVRVVPTALGTAMDINLSNESLVFISVTFATMVSYFIYYGRSMQLLWNLRVKQGETCLMICMCFFHLQCKSAAPIFLLLFAFAFRCFIHND
jgi:solute carrier family 35 protein C2